MVQVTNYAVRQRKDGTKFIALEITGGLEFVQSQTTGKFYATVRKCSIPSTFEQNVAEMMIGQQIDGEIIRVAVDPYDFVNKRTGEVMQLAYSYAYRPSGSVEAVGLTPVKELELAGF